MPQLGPLEILVILFVALLVFGPRRLPEIGRQVGRALTEVRRVQHSMTQDLHDLFTEDMSDQAAPAPTLGPKAIEPTPDEGEERPAGEVPPGGEERPAGEVPPGGEPPASPPD